MVSFKGQARYGISELKGILREQRGMGLRAELRNFTAHDSTEVTCICRLSGKSVLLQRHGF